MGAKKLETVKTLVDFGADYLNFRSFAGATVLMHAVENEDSSPEVIRFILEKLKCSSSSVENVSSFVNIRMEARTFKWKSLLFVAKLSCRTGVLNSGLMKMMATWAGLTALGFAVIRGDVEIVKILLENGADPYIENDLGMNAFDICEKAGPFPSVQRMLEEHLNK